MYSSLEQRKELYAPLISPGFPTHPTVPPRAAGTPKPGLPRLLSCRRPGGGPILCAPAALSTVVAPTDRLSTFPEKTSKTT